MVKTVIDIVVMGSERIFLII